MADDLISNEAKNNVTVNDTRISNRWVISNATFESDQEEYWAITATRTENLVCPPLIMSLGLIGNILSFVVMSRKRMRRTSIGVYCMVLAISDSLVCNPVYPNTMNVAINNRMLFDGIGTNIYLFLSYLGAHTSTWIIVSITIDRFISVNNPLKANFLCTPGKAKIVTGVIVTIFTIFDGINYLWLLKDEILTEDFHMFVGRTDDVTRYFNSTWHLIDAAITNIVPSPAIITFNVITMVKLRQAQKQRSQMRRSEKNKKATKTEENDKKLYLMLISVTMVFATITIPFFTWTIYTGHLEHWKNMDAQETAKRTFILFSFIHLYCINHSINFYIYCLTGQKFREELWQVVRDINRKLSVKRRKSVNLEGLTVNPSNNLSTVTKTISSVPEIQMTHL